MRELGEKGADADLLKYMIQCLAQRTMALDVEAGYDIKSAEYCPVSLQLTAAYLAVDGYHPSALGYRVWANGLRDLLVGRFRD